MGLLIVILVFLTTFLFMMSFFKRIESRQRPVDRLSDYISVDRPEELQDDYEEKKEKYNLLKAIGEQLSKVKLLSNLTKSTTTTLIQADIPLTGEELAVIQLSLAVPLSYIIMLVTSELIIGIIAFILFWMMPLFYIRHKKAVRVKKIQ